MSKRYSRQKLDLTGQRFGHLTVLDPAENVGTKTAWRCLCDCGQETVVKTCHLRCGHTKTCGCQNGVGGPRAVLGLTYIDGTCVEMLAAKTVRRNNTSGVPGVDWQASKRLWRASICFKGKRHYLGSFTRFEDAVKARKQAEKEMVDPFLREFVRDTGEAKSQR